MQYKANEQQFKFGEVSCKIYVPDYEQLKAQYTAPATTKHKFPYWAKLWPSSLALCQYITDNTALFKNKTVVELAAGLGLPSMLAARFASHVTCSDYANEALPWILASAKLNNLSNIEARLIDWNHFPQDVSADIILLSDINYDPADFEELYKVIAQLLRQKCIIVLTTPQRLMAKPFIEQLLPFCTHNQTIPVTLMQEQTDIFLLRLS